MNKEDFVKIAQMEYPEAFKVYSDTNYRLSVNNDYAAIFVKCYLCGKEGHISIKCEDMFYEFEGNLKKQINRIKNQLKQGKMN